MTKYIVEVLEGQKLTAGSKAKEDIVRFLQEDGFHKVGIQVPENKISRLLSGRKLWKKSLASLKSGDTIVYQYPAYSRILGDMFLSTVKKVKDIQKIIVIHDLDSMRKYRNQPKDIKRELQFLDSFDAIIAHNDTMKAWLVKNDVRTPIISLEIFDYYETIPTKDASKNNPIVFAGNLGKSQFLEQMNLNTPTDLFGIAPADSYPQNIQYRGAFPSDELGEHLQGSFGLVWDGNSTQECNGMTGEYMRFNNPHKTSLYLTMGIPVIIWKEAALSSFVVENNVGIAVNSLDELDRIIENMSETEYQLLKNNADKISAKLRSGFYIKNAMNKGIAEF
ncbi:sugar transferase [Enterococcus faecium]|nr:sugar transferase [Enterococcus faecium]